MAALTFIVLPRLTLFEASIIPYMTLAGPLIVTLVHRSSLHPGGWCGFILDIIGLILLLGSIALIGFEYYWSGVLGLKFDISNDYNMIVAVFAILVYGFNSYVNYSRKVPAVKEEGLYWANLLSTLLRMIIFMSALMLTLDQYAYETTASLSDQELDELGANLTLSFFFDERFSTPLFGDISGTTDYASLMCIVSSILLSYFSISAVRLQYQVIYMIIPIFISMILVSLFLFLIPFLDHGQINDVVDGPLGPVTLGHIPWEIDIVKRRFVVQIIAAVTAFVSFIIATRHVWVDRSYPYALERTLFDTVIYRGAWTPLQLIIHRNRQDLAKHIKDTKIQTMEALLPGIGVARPDILIGIKNRADEEYNATETKPMIFICTTLWHEEDNEMETLIKSLLRLCQYVNRRKRDPYLTSKELFNLEINIFFDNVFDEHVSHGKNASKRPEWLPKGFTKWQTLNKYVKSFGRIFGQALIDQGQKKVLEDAKTVLTPYGGRLG